MYHFPCLGKAQFAWVSWNSHFKIPTIFFPLNTVTFTWRKIYKVYTEEWADELEGENRITEFLSLEVITWDHLVQHPVQAGSAKAGYPGLCPVIFWVSPLMEIPQTLINFVPVCDQLCKEKTFSHIHMEFNVFQFVIITSCPVTGYCWEDYGLIPSVRYLYIYGQEHFEPPLLKA